MGMSDAHRPPRIVQAAESVGVGRTLFKKICRREGIHKWPQPLARRAARRVRARTPRRAATPGFPARGARVRHIATSARFARMTHHTHARTHARPHALQRLLPMRLMSQCVSRTRAEHEDGARCA